MPESVDLRRPLAAMAMKRVVGLAGSRAMSVTVSARSWVQVAPPSSVRSRPASPQIQTR